jgi:uncharacterized ferredoxin-like protein
MGQVAIAVVETGDLQMIALQMARLAGADDPDQQQADAQQDRQGLGQKEAVVDEGLRSRG